VDFYKNTEEGREKQNQVSKLPKLTKIL